MGVITEKDTDGVKLEFGNAEALTVMAEKTGKYEGFGQRVDIVNAAGQCNCGNCLRK